MKQCDAIIAWTPAAWAALRPDTAGTVAVLPFPDEAGAAKPYMMKAGAALRALHAMPEPQRIATLFIEFHTLIVRDGIDPRAAHRAFLAIDEYRLKIAADIEGAAFADEPDND